MRILNTLLYEQSQDFDLFSHSIILGYRGSLVHGTYKPNHIDDKDVMGIIVPPKPYVFGLRQFGSRGTKEMQKQEWDVVFYTVKKFVSLLLKNNPNVMSLLWLPEKHYIHVNEAGKLLIAHRDFFSSKKAYKSFAGYANAQLERMERKIYKGYMGKKRKTLTDKHGYDTKHAAHCIRLLTCGIEFLETGEFHPDRTGIDSSMLKQIKYGEWSLDKVKGKAEDLFAQIDTVMDNCDLPEQPDYEQANELLTEIHELMLY